MQQSRTIPTLSVAALLHGLRWELDQYALPIAPGITLMCPRGSRVCSRYEDLCKTLSVDDGEPFDYEVAALLEPPVSDLLNWEPGSTLRLLCDVVAVMSADVVGMCRVLWSRDSFLTTVGTSLVFSNGEQTEFFRGRTTIDRPLVGDISVGWKVLRHLIETQGFDTRIVNSLLQFSSAVHSSHLDQACVHLELALRILFNSVDEGVTAEEVATCVERILGRSEVEKHDIITLVRDTFGVRTQLIRHGCVDQRRICDFAPLAYRLTAAVLRRVFLDRDLALAVNASVTA